MRVGVIDRQLRDPDLRPDVRERVEAAITRLANLGFDLVEIDIPELDLADAALGDVVLKEALDVHRPRLAAEAGGYGPGTLALLRAAAEIDDERYRRGLADMARVAEGFQRALAVVDVLAGPAVAYPAPAEDPPFGAPEGEVEARFTGPYNLAGLPALSIPCGIVEDYLPVGLQLGSAAGAEALLLSVSADVRGGRRMRMHDCTWMQIEEYLRGDDRIVLPLGSTEQHALPVAGRRRDPVRAGVAGGGRAAGRAGAARRCPTA